MCGVGAVFSNSKIENLNEILEVINKTLHHRGPDGKGTWIGKGSMMGLSHTRLSIIDLTQNSAQPLISHDQRYVITFNGEIFNYIELKDICVSKGSIFKSEGDTEVIIELYRHFGSNISTMLRGMWAFALHDLMLNQVFVSRDPFGIKPLFYGEKNGALIFSSEIKSFHKIDDFFLEKDEISLTLFKEYKQYDRGNWTFFKNIKRFPGSHHIMFNLSEVPSALSLKPVRYWDLSKKASTNMSEKLSTDKLKNLFIDSIKLHMRSDVPIGFCLSGGIDSSSIVSVAKIVSPGSTLKTFTTRFPNHERIDETAWATMINDHVSSESHFIEPSSRNFKADFKTLLEVQDEPFGSASIYSQFCIFREISAKGIKVVLDGQGADEIFGGYHSFFPYYINSLLKKRRFLEAYVICRQLKKNYNYTYPIVETLVSRAKQKIKIILKKILRRGSPASMAPKSQFCLYYYDIDKSDTLEKRLGFIFQPIETFETFLQYMVFEGNVPMLLRFEDRNSMAFSIESRVPFLINELVEFSLMIPSKMKMKNGITKYILRKSMKGLVPSKVLGRMDKLGFPAPDKEWLKELYDLNVEAPFSREWIDLTLETWECVLKDRKIESMNLLSLGK